MLPEYRAPGVTRDRLYLDAMEKIYSHSSKVLIDSESSGNMLYLPIDKLISQSQAQSTKARSGDKSSSEYDGIELESSKNGDEANQTDSTNSTRKGRF